MQSESSLFPELYFSMQIHFSSIVVLNGRRWGRMVILPLREHLAVSEYLEAFPVVTVEGYHGHFWSRDQGSS